MNGKLYLVSAGPGHADLIPPLALAALNASEAVVGYELYLRWIEPWIRGKDIYAPPLTREKERATLALDLARAGKTVSLVSSGDIGVYAMAALAFEELREDDTIEVEVIPGITAANACASLLGSPLSHDFATLSLSDLLCPWEWIETRARHIAQADLSCAMYNVQSAGRPGGVYKVLRLMLEHKRPDTVCGVVRNAYRPGQTVEIATLGELLTRSFDMLTTIAIGNRFTRRKGKWMFTPRGYNEWDAHRSGEAPATAPPPPDAVWVFSGTSDGNALAAMLAEQGHAVVVSAASDYGEDVARASVPGAHAIGGRMGVEARCRLLRESNARAIVDATHPYAVEMSRQLLDLAGRLALPCLRFERPGLLAETADALRCADMEDAARIATERGRRIFLATGGRDLATFLNAPGAREREWFVRVTPQAATIEAAVRQGVPRAHVCAMQGPFPREFNEALWRAWNIDFVVTKDSGEPGGFRAKLDAARALGLPILVVERPALALPNRHSGHAAVASALEYLLKNPRKTWPSDAAAPAVPDSAAPRPPALALPENPRKTWPSDAAAPAVPDSTAPRPPALALPENPRKTWPSDAAAPVVPDSTAPRPPTLALPENPRKTLPSDAAAPAVPDSAAPRPPALALPENPRKTWPSDAAAPAVPDSAAPRPPALALPENPRKTSPSALAHEKERDTA